MTLVAVLVALAAFTVWSGVVAQAHHRPGHSGGPGGGGTDEPKPASIDLITCDDGTTARWPNADLTFEITDVSGVGSQIAQEVRDGVLEWNTVQTTYTLTEVTTGTPDISINLYFKIIPGYILGAALVTCPADGQIQSANIDLGVKGLSSIGNQNLSAHEVGHALGLGHADKKGDLMDPRFERKEEGKALVCPSTLDVGGLTSTVNPYSIDDAAWSLLPCS